MGSSQDLYAIGLCVPSALISRKDRLCCSLVESLAICVSSPMPMPMPIAMPTVERGAEVAIRFSKSVLIPFCYYMLEDSTALESGA